MIRRMRTAGLHAPVLARALRAAGAALAGCFIAACPVVDPLGRPEPVECEQYYSLEIANEATDRVRLRVKLMNQFFVLTRRDSGVIELARGERKTFDVSFGFVGCDEFDLWENNRLVALFSDISFYGEGSSVPYRTYAYAYSTTNCPDSAAPCSGDEERYVHLSSDGTRQKLFVKSPYRPFYLERDKNDPDLARIVITFVPSAESGIRNGAKHDSSREPGE